MTIQELLDMRTEDDNFLIFSFSKGENIFEGDLTDLEDNDKLNYLLDEELSSFDVENNTLCINID